MSNGFEQGLQVILQGPDEACAVRCDGIYDVPCTNPAYLAVVPDSSPTGRSEASALRFELLKRLQSLPGARAEGETMPCGSVPVCRTRYYCHAWGVPQCRTVIVLVGDPVDAWSNWDEVQPNTPSEIIPLVPPHTTMPKSMPAPLDVRNAKQWTATPIEFVPQILAAAGISSSEARLFISYRVAEASPLCDQLFDALNRAGFDVFVDRFRIAVGADFQQRILEELAHKSMAIFLESPGILASKWTRYEAAVAKSSRLGILALHPPGGQIIPDIDASRRLLIGRGDWNKRKGTLKPAALTAVVDRIRHDHAAADIRRRQLLRDSMRRALQQAGIVSQRLLPTGAIEAVTVSGASYVLWLPPRPAELPDFHHVATAGGSANATRAIFGPASHLIGRAREGLRWLSTVSDIPSFDESQIYRKANILGSGGTL